MQVVQPKPTRLKPILSRSSCRPEAERYSATTWLPGASEVFTHGLRVRPFSAALRASRPAPISTFGFEVLVQDVIAAITTSPWPISIGLAVDGEALLDVAGLLVLGAERLLEAGPDVLERDAALGPLRPGHRRDDCAEVELERVGEDGVRRVLLAVEALRLRIGLDQLDALLGAGRHGEVGERLLVDGKKPQVAPYSGAMLPIVARSASVMVERPGPKNSTNLPTTFFLRSICVTVSTRSVAVTPGRSSPVRRKPITSGSSIESGWPSMQASASMPPTPQPSTARPLTMVVCESVPTSESG